MTADPFIDPTDQANREPLDEGGIWLLDLVAAVDHLRRGYRPGLTVWDALAEAVRWTVDPTDDESTSVPDPLADALRRLADTAGPQTSAALQGALRRWVITMADRYNCGYHWPHPTPRRGFPPPAMDLGTGRT